MNRFLQQYWHHMLIILLLSTVFALAARQANAQTTTSIPGKVNTPKIQMLSGTFANQNLPEDGTTVTLVSIPFTLGSVGKLEATSLIDAQFGGGGCCGQGGPIVTEVCTLSLDSTILFTSSWSSNSTLPASFSMTTTSKNVSAGNHTVTVQCTGSTDTGTPGEVVLARSGGTSLIVVG